MVGDYRVIKKVEGKYVLKRRQKKNKEKQALALVIILFWDLFG